MKHLLSLILSATAVFSSSAQLTISGTRVMEITPASSTGLRTVYVVENGSDAAVSYSASSSNITWQCYSRLGGGYAEDVEGIVREGNKYTIPTSNQDLGYIITDGSSQLCFWIVDYSQYIYNINGVSPAESDCDRVWLNIDGEAPEMPYYSINGHRELVDRQIPLEYTTLTFDESSYSYVPSNHKTLLVSAVGKVSTPVPLCDTQFTIMPDRFASEWGSDEPVSSNTFISAAVNAETKAEQAERDVDNEQGAESLGLGGSAPCDITFTAAVTDAAIFHRWEVSTDPEFNESYLTYDQLEFSHTFTEAGNTFVRFVANNAEGTCEYIGETYTIAIGESKLDCPNAFSPGNADGVNDEWKVSYSSIVDFHCEIFNRWGKKLATLTDPSQGWDGKVGGKTVGSGVYFYVIKARGADGKDYKLSGDINVINSRKGMTPSVEPEL